MSAWLLKNMRRLGRYSHETLPAAKKLLNSYLLNREFREALFKHPDLHLEVLKLLTYLTQAQQLQVLERLAQVDGRHGVPPPGA